MSQSGTSPGEKKELRNFRYRLFLNIQTASFCNAIIDKTLTLFILSYLK